MKKLIKTDGTKYAQNLQAFAIVDTKQTDGKPIMVSAEVLEEAFENASAEDKAAFENVIHFDVEGEEITVTPTTSQQVKTPSKGHNAITKVTVEAAPLETAAVTPTTSEQTITATGSGKIGLSSITVAAVTSAIDANIEAGNIKKGVTILGVEGTYEGE